MRTRQEPHVTGPSTGVEGRLGDPDETDDPDLGWLYTHPRVLVVDDDEDTRDLVAAMVRSRGMSVVTAPDGPSGVEAAMSGPFDVIIVDVVMPGVDGIEVLHEIHAHVDSTVPVVTMTAQPRRAPKSTSLGQGAVAHLRKPLQRSVLIDVIDKLL